ncbi:hypothetical protein F5141DRAFT_663367 [Pisolithus sp. B1]|nr:hypothetical protein F5141DRAFT_663367 [Pisolithus sp. B1]
MQFPMHLPLHRDTSDDGLPELLSFFGLNQSSQGAPGLAAPARTTLINQGTARAGYDNAYVGSDMSNQTVVYGGIAYYSASGIGFPQDVHTSTTYHPTSKQAFQYGDNAHGTTSNTIRGTCGNMVGHPTVPNQTIAYGGTVRHDAPSIGLYEARGSTVHCDTRGQILLPYDHGTFGQALPPYDVNMPKATLNAGIHDTYSGAVNYSMANQVGGYGGIAPNDTPHMGVHESMLPLQYNQHQVGALSGHDNTVNMDMHGPLPVPQYNQCEIDPPAGHDNMASVHAYAPPAPAPYNQYQFGFTVESHTNNTPPMSSFNQPPVISVNSMDLSPIEHVPALDPSSENELATEVLPPPGNCATMADLPVETGDVNSPSSQSARLDTASPDVAGTPLSSFTVESVEQNTPPAEVSNESGYSVIPYLQTDYYEDLVPLPLHTPDDRSAWSTSTSGQDRNVENHIVIFKRRGDTRFSLWGVPMLDCIDPLSQLLLDPEKRIDCLSGDGESHILLKILWPGYEKVEHVKSLGIRASDNQIMKRTELVRAVAREFRQFCKRCTSGEYVSTNPEWRLGEGGLSFNDVSLSSIWNPEGNVWIPAFRRLFLKSWKTRPKPAAVGTSTANVSK